MRNYAQPEARMAIGVDGTSAVVGCSRSEKGDLSVGDVCADLLSPDHFVGLIPDNPKWIAYLVS